MKPLLCLLLCASPLLAAPPKPMVEGLKNPESVCVAGGKIYVSVIGERDTDGDGAVLVIEDGKAVPFATGLNDPKGLAAYQTSFFVTDKTQVWKIDEKGKAEVFAAAKDFPVAPLFLNDIAIDVEKDGGSIFVSDSGDRKGKGGAIYKINIKDKKVTTVLDGVKYPALNFPNGILLGETGQLIFVDFGSGDLNRMNLATGVIEKLAEGFDGGDGLVWDHFGRLYVSSWKTGKLMVIPRPGAKPLLLMEGFQSAADICLDPTGTSILVPDMKAGTVTAVPIQVPGEVFNNEPLKIETEVAFANLKWTGWKGETDDGKADPLRPIVLTHAGDGSGLIYVATEHGVIHSFPNDPKATETKVFLDIRDRVSYNDKQNEEGFLGLCFHPKYKQNGEFFVFYTPKKEKMMNIVSRFKVSKDDPNKADPASEEILMKFQKPYWNHDGGTIVFGPDGYLYITHGDGGLGGDPHENGQNLDTLLGKVLRIDVDSKGVGKTYGIPKDNPFVGKENTRPEIWAYGLRNVWRMAFDSKSGQLWAADVGQNLWEEINLIQKGGNYGWNRREGFHPYGAKGSGPKPEFIDPIWEYHHDLGKSVTGGSVYRGKQFPELDGAYIHGDYVTGKIWALTYDEKQKRVVANRPIKDKTMPILSFGTDDKGEIYLLTFSPTGKGIYKFVATK